MVGWPPQTSKEISSSEGGETLTRGAGPGASSWDGNIHNGAGAPPGDVCWFVNIVCIYIYYDYYVPVYINIYYVMYI
jgi:hypothetical protein